jgi:hypothetical protein
MVKGEGTLDQQIAAYVTNCYPLSLTLSRKGRGKFSKSVTDEGVRGEQGVFRVSMTSP